MSHLICLTCAGFATSQCYCETLAGCCFHGPFTWFHLFILFSFFSDFRNVISSLCPVLGPFPLRVITNICHKKPCTVCVL